MEMNNEIIEKERTFLYAIEILQPRINHALFQTDVNNREDLEQELKLKIFEKLEEINLEKTYGFWDFLENKR